jgi:hypothetical protein
MKQPSAGKLSNQLSHYNQIDYLLGVACPWRQPLIERLIFHAAIDYMYGMHSTSQLQSEPYQ